MSSCTVPGRDATPPGPVRFLKGHTMARRLKPRNIYREQPQPWNPVLANQGQGYVTVINNMGSDTLRVTWNRAPVGTLEIAWFGVVDVSSPTDPRDWSTTCTPATLINPVTGDPLSYDLGFPFDPVAGQYAFITREGLSSSLAFDNGQSASDAGRLVVVQ